MTSYTSAYVCELLQDAKNKIDMVMEILAHNDTDCPVTVYQSLKELVFRSSEWMTSACSDAKILHSNSVINERSLGIDETLITKYEP